MHKKKSLGQHFLTSQGALNAIVGALDPTGTDLIVEIGPGEGILTEKILPFAGKVIAIEKDHRLVPFLQEKFGKYDSSRFEIIEGDALEFNPDILAQYKDFDYCLVGNIPYYITGALLRKYLSAKHQPTTLVFLIQKEVAERIARSKKESILSLSVKAYGIPKYIKSVPAGAFTPPPKVDSAILLVDKISRKNFEDAAHEEKFFELLKKGFGQKRKMLLSNLGKEFVPAFEKLKLSEKVRAEDVPLQTWLALARYSSPQK